MVECLIVCTHFVLSSRSLVSIFLATRELEDCRRDSAESFIWTTDAWGGEKGINGGHRREEMSDLINKRQQNK